MTIERKVGMGIAGQPSGATDVADVFSTYLYTGDGGNLDITNGIDLAGKGGMVWLKSRSNAYPHTLWSSETTGNLVPNSSDAINNVPLQPTFNSDGFTFPNNATYNGWATTNSSSANYASWTFRKKEKFFDIVTWTGNSTAGRTISHNLGSVPAMMVVKMTNGTYNWNVYHSGIGATKFLELDTNNAGQTSSAVWNNTAPTDSVFTVGQEYSVNQSGKTYVAYLFADNSSEDAEDQMIKCGSYTGNGSATGPVVNLGWEPQFLMVKRSDSTSDWFIVDSMRGLPVGGYDPRLRANTSAAEETGAGTDWFGLTATGFNIVSANTNINASGGTYIYMAIRAPMMVEPEAATDVFAIDTRGSTGDGLKPAYRSGFPVDLAIRRSTGGSGGNVNLMSKLTGGNYFRVNTSNAEAYDQLVFDYNNGYYGITDTNASFHAYMWKRAKGYMDVVAYTGNTTAGRTVAHSLGVAPEMMWVKCRTDTTSWMVYHAALTGTKFLTLDTSSTPSTHDGNWYNTNPTDSVFTVGDGATNVAQAQIAYLFATLAGISKVGSYTGNGSNQTIDCGFSAGSRFILIKRTDAVGDWFFWDSVRGIVAGNDPHFSLNTTATHVTTDDSVDPANAGFIVNQVSATNINVSSATYIFYAIA